MAGIRRDPAARIGTAARYVALVVGAVLFLVPFYLVLRNGLSAESDITAPDWQLFPKALHWGNLSELLSDPALPMTRSLVNSVAISVTQTVGVLILSGLAGYGLARIPYRHANA